MRKWLLSIPIAAFLFLQGCSEGIALTGDKPPNAAVQAGGKTYETKLGTYCWSTKDVGHCVDTVGPVELLKGKQPIPVRGGETIRFVMDYEPQPNRFHLTQFNGAGYSEVKLNENSFQAPQQKGLYYYIFGVWWMDEKREHVSLGDAFYNFVIEVN